MATKFISDLTAVTSISDTDVLVIDDGDHNYKIAWQALKALLPSVSSITTTNGSITITTTDGQTFSVTPHDPTKQGVLTFDDVPVSGGTNPVKSGGIYTALGNKLDASAYTVFTGATASERGQSGIVPAPPTPGLLLASSGSWQAPDTEPVENSGNPITSGGVFEALKHVAIDVDSALSSTSENPVQNKALYVLFEPLVKATVAETETYLGL